MAAAHPVANLRRQYKPNRTQSLTVRWSSFYENPIEIMLNVATAVQTSLNPNVRFGMSETSFRYTVPPLSLMSSSNPPPPLSLLADTPSSELHCKVCDKLFHTQTMYQAHLRLHAKPGVEEEQYQCDVCGKSFAVPARLTRHYRTHTGEKPFKCEYCLKSFSVKENLSVHRRIHTRERPYKCEVCERSFEHSGKLHRHMRIHTGERPHKCQVCAKTFIQSGQLVIHMRTHTGEKPYVCQACGKGFTCSKQLKVHMRTHTGEKPYKCDICGKAFGYNHVLKLHQVVHFGEKVYKCTICKETFNSKKAMELHIRSHDSSSFATTSAVAADSKVPKSVPGSNMSASDSGYLGSVASDVESDTSSDLEIIPKEEPVSNSSSFVQSPPSFSQSPPTFDPPPSTSFNQSQFSQPLSLDQQRILTLQRQHRQRMLQQQQQRQQQQHTYRPHLQTQSRPVIVAQRDVVSPYRKESPPRPAYTPIWKEEQQPSYMDMRGMMGQGYASSSQYAPQQPPNPLRSFRMSHRPRTPPADQMSHRETFLLEVLGVARKRMEAANSAAAASAAVASSPATHASFVPDRVAHGARLESGDGGLTTEDVINYMLEGGLATLERGRPKEEMETPPLVTSAAEVPQIKSEVVSSDSETPPPHASEAPLPLRKRKLFLPTTE